MLLASPGWQKACWPLDPLHNPFGKLESFEASDWAVSWGDQLARDVSTYLDSLFNNWQWAVVEAMLVEQLLPIAEVRSSNPVIGKNLLWIFTVNCIEKAKINKKRRGMAHFKNLFWVIQIYRIDYLDQYFILFYYLYLGRQSPKVEFT